jgi:3-deoxy-D-manno-octulosonic-acid transferase
MQTQTYAERVIELGATPNRVHVTGNIKFDAAPDRCTEERVQSLRASLKIPKDAPVLVFGSTRPGDEALLASCLEGLLAVNRELRVIVAPRHLDRLDEAASVLSPWPMVRKSELAEGREAPDVRVILLDTLGELSDLYAIADVAVVGGSFSGEVGGHNPIEPAAQDVAVVFGPDMRNFPDAARALVDAGGAVQVPANQLAATLDTLLHDADRRRALGERAAEVVEKNRGALERTIELIAPVVSGLE